MLYIESSIKTSKNQVFFKVDLDFSGLKTIIQINYIKKKYKISFLFHLFAN